MEKIFLEIFESLPRQGPGDKASTRRAFEKLRLPEYPEILDAGCGTGAQTLTLAALTRGRITALDSHPEFIKILRKNIRRKHLEERIIPLEGDMGNLTFPPESFDAIWSEGAAYIIGFGRALWYWRKFLTPGGGLAASELVWFRDNPPEEAAAYFTREYPDIKYYKDIFSVISGAGYELLEYFPLPESAWWENFYSPAIKKLAEMKIKHGTAKSAMAVIGEFEKEIDFHRKYSGYCGYGFYVMKKKI